MEKRLMRSRTAKILTGVCGGLGHYFGWDPVLVRLAFVASLFLVPPVAILGYLALRIAMPVMPPLPVAPEGEAAVPAPRSSGAWASASTGVLLVLLGISFFVPGGFLRFWDFGFHYLAAAALVLVAGKMLWDMVAKADYNLFVAVSATMLATLAVYVTVAWPIWDEYHVYLKYTEYLLPAFFIVSGVALLFRHASNRLLPSVLGIAVFVFVGAYAFWGPSLFAL